MHRPRYDDWSLPKGKLEPGEGDEDAALREVAEETGYACTLGDEVATFRYRDLHGRAKQVRFFRMAIESALPWAPNAEIDERRWISAADAATLLTYETDRNVLQSLGERSRTSEDDMTDTEQRRRGT